ncbi:MAG: restriction endonuclease subunit S [Myxococcota bacterium]
MTNVPTGWVESTFGEINRFSSSTVDPSKFEDEEFELYSVPTFPSGKPERLLGASIGSSKQVVAPRDVLVCKINPRINRVWEVADAGSSRQIASSEWIVVRVPELDHRFLRLYFSSPRFRDLICEGVTGVGGSLTRAQPKRVATFSVPIAPINEQHRIADKLDAVLARVDACRERLDRVPAILKRFRQSVLAAATSGKLTEDWRAERGVEFAWKEEPLHALCSEDRIITYGVIKLGSEVPDGVPCLRTSNVRWLKIETEGMKRIDPALSQDYSRTILDGGEVLVNVRGTLGGVAVAEPDMAGWNVSREVAVVPIDEREVDPWFLAYWVGSDSSQRWLARVKKGVAYVGINIEDLRNLPVRIPTVPEQQAIVERVQSLHRRAEALEKTVREVQSRVENLTPTLLAKAFRGELVPQDPNDEPASVLLERIRAERAAAAAKPRKRKGGRRSAASKKKESAMLKRSDIGDEHLSAILKERGPLTAEALWSTSQLEIDDFYDQLKAEEERGLLLEKRGESSTATRMLEAAA